MNLETIACINCGAPLQVPRDARFVTCTHCHTSLAVRRNDSATYTEKLAQIDERTGVMESELAQLHNEAELARIDREWEQERQTYLSRGNDGQMVEPSVVGSVIFGIIAVVFGMVWIGIASSQGAPAMFPLLGVVFMVIGIAAAVFGAGKASEFTAARERHERLRSQISVPQIRQPNSSGHDSTRDPDRPTAEIDAFLDREQQRANSESAEAG
ncbi:MAG TPA: hypothetical protein VHX65_03315 [Pirellulales bacterium]|jgi:LSD1 subclass zinc finger protein|nr:hypothetical protein [Pirellulales bacterium]